MNIRRALPLDADELARVESTRPQAAGWGSKGFATEICQPCSCVWCACEERKIIGFLALRSAAGFAEILNVAVLAECGKQGVGSALLAKALKELKKQGPCQITLEVAQDNVPAQGLYAKGGFKRLGIRKDFYGPGKDAWIMGTEV